MCNRFISDLEYDELMIKRIEKIKGGPIEHFNRKLFIELDFQYYKLGDVRNIPGIEVIKKYLHDQATYQNKDLLFNTNAVINDGEDYACYVMAGKLYKFVDKSSILFKSDLAKKGKLLFNSAYRK